MVKKNNKKIMAGNKKNLEVEEEDESEKGGKSMDDAFADDEDVEYAPSKPRKVKKKELEEELDEAEEEVEEIEKNSNASIEQKKITLKMSKPVSKIKKGDRIRVDGKEYTVDQHYLLIDHGSTKEMAIECYDKDDKDYQIRYFSDQVEETIEFYELQEIIFVRKIVNKIEW